MKVFLIILVTLLAVSCQVGTYSRCGDSCKDWEICNEEKGWCETAEGFCDYNKNECEAPYYCDSEHKCIDISCNSEFNTCEDYEICMTSTADPYGTCYPKVGRCNSYYDCTFPDQICLADHRCDKPCINYICTSNSTCEVNADMQEECICDAGFYRQGEECIAYPPDCNGVTCSDHGTCIVNADETLKCDCNEGYKADGLSCNEIDLCIDVECENWQQCDAGSCILKDGFCETTCDGDDVCNKTHQCIGNPCEEWEDFIQGDTETDDGCTLTDGFCYDDNDCTDEQICDVNHECSDVCIGSRCGETQTCIASNHAFECRCDALSYPSGVECIPYASVLVKPVISVGVISGNNTLVGWKMTDISNDFNDAVICTLNDLNGCTYKLQGEERESYLLVKIHKGLLKPNYVSDLYVLSGEAEFNDLKAGIISMTDVKLAHAPITIETYGYNVPGNSSKINYLVLVTTSN